MEQNGQSPSLRPVVVTGATGGVGSLAIDMLCGRGYEVMAGFRKGRGCRLFEVMGATHGSSCGNQSTTALKLTGAGAARSALSTTSAVTRMPGLLGQWVTAAISASVGLASRGEAGNDFIMPFILRAVSLLGINKRGVRPVMHGWPSGSALRQISRRGIWTASSPGRSGFRPTRR